MPSPESKTHSRRKWVGASPLTQNLESGGAVLESWTLGSHCQSQSEVEKSPLCDLLLIKAGSLLPPLVASIEMPLAFGVFSDKCFSLWKYFLSFFYGDVVVCLYFPNAFHKVVEVRNAEYWPENSLKLMSVTISNYSQWQLCELCTTNDPQHGCMMARRVTRVNRSACRRNPGSLSSARHTDSLRRWQGPLAVSPG